MKKFRLYLDTSVIGGQFDPEFERPSRRLFDELADGRFAPVVSGLVEQELAGAPDRVRETLRRFEWEVVPESAESVSLADEYVKSGVLSIRCWDDCRHVALATVADVDMIVSWNFRHLVNVQTIRGFNAVNLRMGYSLVEIRSPLEVINYE